MTAPVDAAARPWVPGPLETAIQERAATYRTLDADAVEAEVHRLLDDHERYMDHECISLYAGTNVMNPRAVRLLATSVGSRPSLGYPGDKYEMGMQYAEQLEILAAEVLKDLFHARYVEYRVGSGSLANLYAYMVCARPGDLMLAFPPEAAGHVGHHEGGAAGLYGLDVRTVPFDGRRMAVDLDGLAREARALKPKIIMVAGSMCLFPYDVPAVRAIADEVGAYVVYDAAHMSGLIASGAFQQPLAEGAHLLTCSTYKSFGGPPSGLVLTNDAELAQRLEYVAYPGMTANFDLSKTAALIVAALDLREHGPAYAQMCIDNAVALATALDAKGVPVYHVEGRGFTASQHVGLPAQRYGGGTPGSRLLERANILVSGIGLPGPTCPNDFNAIRIGTQEVTRWGMTPDSMVEVAKLMARVLVGGGDPAAVREDVIALRRNYQTLHYLR